MSDYMPLSEIPVVMRALGFYPTEQEVGKQKCWLLGWLVGWFSAFDSVYLLGLVGWCVVCFSGALTISASQMDEVWEVSWLYLMDKQKNVDRVY